MKVLNHHLSAQMSSKRTWKTHFITFIVFVLHLGLWLFGILPFTKWRYINELYCLCWVLEIVGVTFHVFHSYTETIGAEYSLGGVVSSLLFLTQIFAHLTLLWDALSMRSKRVELHKKFLEIDFHLFESKLQIPMDMNACDWEMVSLLFWVFVQLAFWHTIISWTTFQVQVTATALFWFGFPSSLALQFRLLEFLKEIVLLNSRLLVVRRNINLIGERNLKYVFKCLKKVERKSHDKSSNFFVVELGCNEMDDEQRLVELKLVHGKIYVLFQTLNDCYSWSLLAFMAMYFIDFVTNSYWIVLAMITQGRNTYALIQNCGFLWIVVVMLSTICWHCQKSYDYSRQIGCLIFKLVKPMGNKRYNDLVGEFSLQTMHQQFVITAKEFFSLNLNLLGSMVAAIVTYLVILIQFMFTEKNNLEHSMRTTVKPSNVTSTLATFTTLH